MGRFWANSLRGPYPVRQAEIELFQAGKFPLDRLVTPFRFAGVNVAMDASAACTVLKPVLRFN